MTALRLHNNEINSIFDLVGDNEDDMTYALGWSLSISAELRKLFARAIGLPDLKTATSINLQRHEKDRGFTDIELEAKKKAFAIVEAKRGWTLPTVAQLKKYSRRRPMRDQSLRRKLIVLTAFDEGYVRGLDDYPAEINGIPVVPLSWSSVLCMALTARAQCKKLHEKWVLEELTKYLGRLFNMNRQESNNVYVVSLGARTFSEGSSMTFIEVVEKYSRYFHPIGGGYPVEPPNYIAFRYYGMLQSIHHIERIKTIRKYSDWRKSLSDAKIEPHFLYTLGPAIIPAKEVRSGPIRNTRLWCHLDTLLTANTVQEAGKITAKRMESAA